MELQQWMSSIGLSFDPVLDNKIHRCDENGTKKSDHIWYIGSTEYAPSGRERTTLTVGNHKTGEQWYYSSGKASDYNEEERAYYAKKQKEAEESAEKELREKQAKACEEAEKIWAEACRDISHEYLSKKQIGVEAAKSAGIRQRGDVLLIPMRDIEGKLWGIQRIWPDGTKRFLTGQRKIGCFFTFCGGSGDPAIVCEGFATGASIFAATGLTTYAAMDSGNLNHVAKSVKVPGTRIIICGDDDRWNPSGKNVGREKATEAALLVGGIAVFPEFKELENDTSGMYHHKPTDFNDLHCLEGLDEVRRQIERGIRVHEESRRCEQAAIPHDAGDDKNTRCDSSGPKDIHEANDRAHSEQGYESGLGLKDHDAKEKAEKVAEGIKYLGHSGSDYFYTTGSNKQIVTLARSAHSSTNLLDLQPLSYWMSNYGYFTNNGVPKISWDKAASDLMEKCRNNGIFKAEKVRGVGCWLDDEKLIIHIGDKLIVDKKEIEIGEFKSRYIYELGRSIPKPSTKPLNNEECEKIIDAVSSLNWKHKDDAIYFLGWLTISKVCGALRWRPHVWLTGPSGSGKTTLLDRVAKKLSSDWVVIPVSSSTEAGIRQNICKDALPVIFDEAETSDRKSGAKIQNILSLIRQASSNTDAKIMKGTSDQGGMQFTINSMFLLSSIRVNLIEEQDVNRFTVCELLRNNPEEWPRIQNKIDAIKSDWGDRMLARMIECFPAYMENVASISEEISKVHSQRAADQYAPLVAGYLSLLTVGKISKEKIKEIVSKLEISNKSAIEEEHDEFECLSRLLNSKIRIINTDGEGRDDSLSMLIDLAFQEVPVNVHHYRNSLQVYGLKVSSCGTVLHVANNHPEVYKFFIDTKWHGLWKNSLIRVNGARKNRTRFGSVNQMQCVDIPKSSIIIG